MLQDKYGLKNFDYISFTIKFSQVDLVAFDKTGTLTEDSLDLTEIISTGTKGYDQISFYPSSSPENFQGYAAYNDNVLRCMATCHCLTIIKEKIVGDPLDIKMFEATNWNLVEPKVHFP